MDPKKAPLNPVGVKYNMKDSVMSGYPSKYQTKCFMAVKSLRWTMLGKSKQSKMATTPKI